MADGDLELLAELAERFVVDGPDQVALARAALASGDAQALAAVIHRLRGSIGIFQAKAAFDQATALEQAAREGSLEGAAAAVDDLAVMIRAVCDDLAARVANRA